MDPRTIFELSPQDYKQLIFTMECRVFNGEALDAAVLDQIPRRMLQESSVLLEWQAERYLHDGKLTEARSLSELAVRGFAQQTYTQKLNSALSLLAIINLRLGELRDAETVLVFLKEQWARDPDELEGRSLVALAQGAYLVGDYGKEKHYVMAAKDAFIRQGQLREAVQTGLEIFSSGNMSLSEQEAGSLLLFMEQQVRLDKQWEPYYLAMQGIDYINHGDWESACRLLRQIDQQVLPYEHGTRCLLSELQGALAKGTSLTEQEQGQLQDILKQYGSDMFIRFETYCLLYASARLERNHRHASEYWKSIQAVADITRHPRHLLLLQQEEQKRETLSAGCWTIHLFGKMKFVQGSVEKQDLNWKRKKAFELLTYLLMQHQFSATKEQVMEDLFGSMYADKMANQLYVIVHQLKQTLNKELGFEQAVILKEGLVRLQEQFIKATDLEQYEALLREGDLVWDSHRTKAIELYKQAIVMYGELVPEIRYADWLELRRSSLQDKQEVALKRLARQASDQSQFEQSEAYYKEWIALCPAQEQAYQGIIELYVSNSRKQDALNYYRKWERICMDEFGVDPSLDMDTSSFLH
ncbi:AfsR/SARP family transcriptional regulator [Paenibacillus sp. UNC451MF]|uniref:AfsR/SARP family transcriptional regulator n=1 Tax=Paenibacillus sp. UNC451MF TaxID=1449063 RepID=UPI0004912C16|nr:BTAD domain-containing putative transcriptional regulator [Paenibacillus sp. UNC451MF]